MSNDEIKYCEELLNLKIKNPKKEIKFDDSVKLISYCIRKGTEVAKQSKNKDVVIFIGNTGAGKTTMINYLYGRKMKRLNRNEAKKLNINALQTVVIAEDPIMKIGHSLQSETFMPEIIKDCNANFYYMDCPGFLDNRGSEINIANAVNIRNAISVSRSVKLVMLINYSALLADRGRGLRDMLDMTADLFGDFKNLEANIDSIIVGITQAPINDDIQSAKELNEWILKDLNDDRLKLLASKIFVFDPLDNVSENDWYNRESILNTIEGLTTVKSHEDVFQTVLTSSDKVKLRDISFEISRLVEKELSEINCKVENLEKASAYLSDLENLELVRHPFVTKSLADARTAVISKLNSFISNFNAACLHEKFEDAEELLNFLKSADYYFGDNANLNLDLIKLSNHLKYCKVKKNEEENYRKSVNDKIQAADKNLKEKDRLMQELRDNIEKKEIERKKDFDKAMSEAMREQDKKLENVKLEAEKAKKVLEDIFNKEKKELEKNFENALNEGREMSKKEVQKEINLLKEEHEKHNKREEERKLKVDEQIKTEKDH